MQIILRTSPYTCSCIHYDAHTKFIILVSRPIDIEQDCTSESMPTIASYQIDDDGDIDLLLPHLEEVPSVLHGVLTYVPPAPGLKYRRLAAHDAWTNEEEAEPHESVLPAPDFQLGAWGGAGRPDELQRSSESLQPKEQADLEQSCDRSQDTAPTPDKYVRIRTSSKHLTFSSRYFKCNLRSGLLESETLHLKGHVEFRMGEQNKDAMLIILNIIHGRSREVPRAVDQDMLTELAVIVDYLDCLEVVEPFSDRWVENLRHDVPMTITNDLIQWLCISLVFRRRSEFKIITLAAIRLSRDAVQTLGLPIPESVVGK